MKYCAKILLITMCAVFFVGCGQNAATPSKDRSVSIVDDRGKTVTLAHPAMRIISLEHVHTEKLFSLGLNAEIIGVSHEEADDIAKANPAYGYNEDPQRVIAAQPQLVVAAPDSAEKHADYIAAIEAAGIPVACLNPQAKDYTQKLKILTGVK